MQLRGNLTCLLLLYSPDLRFKIRIFYFLSQEPANEWPWSSLLQKLKNLLTHIV